MGLTMSRRKAVTKATATRYRSASKGAKVVILDEVCATTGWHRDHARKALREAQFVDATYCADLRIYCS